MIQNVRFVSCSSPRKESNQAQKAPQSKGWGAFSSFAERA